MEKTNIPRAIKNGLAIGVTCAGLAVSTILGSIAKENYDMNQIRSNSAKRINITEYHSTSNAEYICMFRHVFSERDKPLYTDTLGACTALIIDSPKENKHGFYHVSSGDESEEIISFIKSNLANITESYLYIQEGDYSNMATKNIHQALRKLGLEDRIKYISQNNNPTSKKILIQEGKLYIPQE